MANYNPPTKVTTLEMPYQALVTRADPTWARDRLNEIEYEFSTRVFRANPFVRGAYNTNSN